MGTDKIDFMDVDYKSLIESYPMVNDILNDMEYTFCNFMSEGERKGVIALAYVEILKRKVSRVVQQELDDTDFTNLSIARYDYYSELGLITKDKPYYWGE